MSGLSANFAGTPTSMSASLPGELIFGMPGATGGYYSIHVSQPDAETMRLGFLPSKSDMPAIASVDILLPQGPKGDAGEADETQVRELVMEYLRSNPPQVTESDPTVPDWAKESSKPAYTAEEVGALSADALEGAIEEALLQAKENGTLGSGGSQDVWELLDRTVLTEPVTIYSKTFDYSQKKLIAMIRPGVAVAGGWKGIGLRADGTYTFSIGNFAMSASEYFIVHIEDFAIINKRFIDWYAAESLPQNGMANAAKRGNGVFEIGIGNGYVTGPINAFVFATSGLLVEGAEIIIMGVKA